MAPGRFVSAAGIALLLAGFAADIAVAQGGAPAPATGPTLHDLRTKILSTDQVLLEYRFRATSGGVHLVSQDREREVAIPVGRDALAEHIAALRAGIAAGETAPDAARELYDTLVTPVAGDLPPESRLVIVPDGALDGLPFAALRAPDGAMLPEQHAISFATSAAALATPPGTRVPRPLPAPQLTPAAVDSFLAANGVALERQFIGTAAADSALAADVARELAAGLPPDVALQRAQVAAIRRGLGPGDWAGYRVIGRMSAPRAGGLFPLWLVPLGLAFGGLLLFWGLRLTPRPGTADGKS